MSCGLLGRKLGHSYSPAIHSLLGTPSYGLFEVEPEQLGTFLQNGDLTGLNVTMPYKQAVVPYLDELTPIAQKLGAVNTIVRRNGKLLGHNTDYFGFRFMLTQSGLDVKGKTALVLGNGGASKTCVAVLEEMGAQVTVISRSGENNYTNIDLHADLIVNTTPVGMYPDTGNAPVELSRFVKLEGVLDVVYNPPRTQLLMDAQMLGIPALGGLWMLIAQAKEAAEWFIGQRISDSRIPRIYEIMRSCMENIILIGMPGCGKTTLGKAVAEHLGRPFVDLDSCIADKAGMSIPEIFAQYGEAHFRRLETQIADQYGKQSGLVIATGGGIVTQNRNYPLLHQNSKIFWLQRALDKLPTDGRPLSKNLSEMFKIRLPLYEKFADFIIQNDGDLEDTIRQILSQMEGRP